MIFYTQSLTELARNVQGFEVLTSRDPKIEQPLVLMGIPFDQPDPATAKTLRQLAIHLGGIYQVSVVGPKRFK